jgi:hypothetical protein
MGEARVGAERGAGAAVRGDGVLRIDRVEFAQQFLCFGKRCSRRRVEQLQVARVAFAPEC